MLAGSGAGMGAGVLAGLAAGPVLAGPVLVGPVLAQAPSSARAAPIPASGHGISPRALGAVGDGQIRFLSERFATLAEARAVYPFAQRLDQSLDWAGIQAALNAAEPTGGLVIIPAGRFIISDTLRLPSSVTLQGEARNASVIDNQNWPLGAPQLANKDPQAFLYVTIRDLTLNGGTHALKVAAVREVAGIVIEGVTTNLQTEANFEFSSLQTCVLRDCHLMDGRFGLHVQGFPCNSVHLFNTRLGRHGDAAIRLRGVDGFVMLGGSIEAGQTPGKATLDIETGGAYAQAIAFEHVYFENTHTVVLRSRGARGVSFGGCKFTGTGGASGALAPYRFDCGDDLICFADNFFHVATTGPANMLMLGHNHALKAGGTLWRRCDAGGARLVSRRFTLAEAQAALFSVELEGLLDAGGGDGGARVWGMLELVVDPGGRQPLRRTGVPLDLLLDADAAQTLGPLGVSMGDRRARVWLDDGDLAAGAAALWFALDLTQAHASVMRVEVA